MLFASLLIDFPVDFLRGSHAHVLVVCVRACVCVCLKML